MEWTHELDHALTAVARHISPVSGGVRPFQTALRRIGIVARADDVRDRLRTMGLLSTNANAPARTEALVLPPHAK